MKRVFDIAAAWTRARAGSPAALDPARREALARYRAAAPPDPRTALAAVRFVVVDVETSGLDPFRDRLLSVGAVAVRGGIVRTADSFVTVLRQARASEDANILVHGIGATAQRDGLPPAAALADFLAYAGRDPLVAFNAAFDRAFVDRAARAALGRRPGNRWLDLACLAPALVPGRRGARGSLDDWLARYGIANHARHDALSDALATAQLLLVVLAEARRRGAATLARLAVLESAQRWLGRS
ncbi:MAG: 3'-5' exonuclease [Burkholderiales bacterium]|nr:3'-5' exonuclease [Burkholderiales bacterium]